MSFTEVIFPITAVCLIIVEIILIISVLRLKNEIQKLNYKTKEIYEGLMTKIKGLVELFIKAQMGKLDAELKTKGFSVEVHKIEGEECTIKK